MEKEMNGLNPNCLDDFLFSSETEKQKLDYILSQKMPFPFAGKNGILLHGTWGTGKSTLAELLPELIEASHAGTWDLSQNIGQMPAANRDNVLTDMFRCGGGLSITSIANAVYTSADKMPSWHQSNHHYFVFDEVDKLTVGAQQSLKAVMGVKRCMFFYTTNYLNKVDVGILNRCHLVEMNQVVDLASYVPLGQAILKAMGLPSTAMTSQTIETIAGKAKGSMRNFMDEIVFSAVGLGGVMPK
jgi:DNA polymerase III delta prime subunit